MARPICTDCAYLGEADASTDFQTKYLSCRFPVPALPPTLRWPAINASEAARSIPRAQFSDGYDGPTITACPVHRVKAQDALQNEEPCP